MRVALYQTSELGTQILRFCTINRTSPFYSGNTSIEAVVLTIPGACVRNEPVRHGATPLHSVGEFTKPQVKGVQCLCLTRA